MTSKKALEKMLGDLKSYESYFADGGYYDNEERFEIIKKDLDLFEKYKKVEKEIGVDFITLIKMLKDDVYINDGGIVDEIGNIYKDQVKSIEHWPVWGFTAGDNVEYAFKDRGKTWALDKEEFYEKLSKQKN